MFHRCNILLFKVKAIQIKRAENTSMILYSLAYTIKMSKKGSHQIKDYFDFVVPPLEGFWWQDGVKGIDYAHKERFNFISCIRMPEFVTDEVLAWAKKEAAIKKGLDFSPVKLLVLTEGKCVCIMVVMMMSLLLSLRCINSLLKMIWD